MKIAVTSEMEYLGKPQMQRHFVNEDYLEYVRAADMSPFAVATGMNVNAVADDMDGLLLTGGKDIHPLLYNEDLEAYGAQKCNLTRDLFEKNLYRAFLSRAKPIFGICRGFQLIGILAGDLSLIQDINKYKEVTVTHNQNGPEIMGDNPVHIMVNRGLIRALIGREILPVNSFHHQGFMMMGKVGPNAWLKQSDNVLGWSRSNDKAKVLEALLLQLPSQEQNGESDTFVGGVQYHPERMMRRNNADRARHLKLFRYVMGLEPDPEGFFENHEEDDDEAEAEPTLEENEQTQTT
jgi:gamma-glutamyl-gamma-aminobutyrate hydrolase PuuD